MAGEGIARPSGEGRSLYLYGGASPMRPGVLAVLRAHGYRPVATPMRADLVAGWGTRRSGESAARRAQRTGQGLLRLEDAFVRSAGLGAWGAPPLGLIADPFGVYYDASAPSIIEARLASDWAMGAAEENDAIERLALFDTLELTKYALPRTDPAPLPERPYTVVIDQTAGDESIARGLADAATFAAMLREALEETDDDVVVRTHPDVMTGEKRGHLAPDDIEALGIRSHRIRHHTGGNLRALLRNAARAHAVTSLAGFEARLMDRPVTVHGLPFYAGWGDPGDRMASPRRTVRRSALEVFAAAYRDLPLYLDPHAGRACDFTRVAEVVSHLRAEAERRATPTDCFGMRSWKHDFVGLHLGGGAPGAFPPGHVTHHRDAGAAIAAAGGRGGRVGFWAAKTGETDRRAVEESGLPKVEIEDGFLRSRGLGALLTFPGSLALDERGIYYDPRSASDLEAMIQTGGFTDETLERADGLIAAYRGRGLTKYNLHQVDPPPVPPDGRPLVIVLGQVEDDASIRMGATGDVRTNEALIRRARAEHPEAFLAYRAHPDVERGLRRGKVPADTLQRVDVLAPRASLPALLGAAARVHVMTSLGGLEAMMHGTPVTCHGAPFYAGWGVTDDRVPSPRRTRRANLREIVAAAYLLYPSMVDPFTRLFTTPEMLMDRIAGTRNVLEWNARLLVARHRWRRLTRSLTRR